VSGKATGGALSFRQFIDGCIRLPDGHGHLKPLVLFPAAEDVVHAMDARGPDGLRRYREIALSWPKKSGKSTMTAAIMLYMLTADPFTASDRECYILADDLAQSKDVVFASACRMVARNGWLSKRCTVSATEIAFRELVRDGAGGTYRSTSILRPLPRSGPGTEGLTPSASAFDETWLHRSWSGLEGLSPSPSRRSPLTVFASFAPLRSQGAGCPWVDVLARARSGHDPNIFISELSGPTASASIPWHTPRWLAQMTALYGSCESKIKRLLWNVVASEDSAFLKAEWLAAALDAGRPEAALGVPGTRYLGGLDVGISYDRTAFVVGHVDQGGRFVVDVVRQWAGTKTKPVDLMAVEEAIIGISQRFPLAGLHSDQWQSQLLQTRLARRGIPGVKSIVTEQAWLDRAVTVLGGAFAKRLIVIPARELELREQLESLEVKETRRDRLRFDSGSGPTESGRHDDLAIALTLALMQVQRDVGRPALPACVCPHPTPCLVKNTGGPLPYGDIFCRQCERWQVVKAAWLAAGGVPDLRAFFSRIYSASAPPPPCWFI